MEIFLFIGPNGENWLFPIEINGKDNPEDQAWRNLADRVMTQDNFCKDLSMMKVWGGNYYEWVRNAGKEYCVRAGWKSPILLGKPFGNGCNWVFSLPTNSVKL